MTTKVYIIESEAGWGQRVDETMTFPTVAKAIKFCEEYNNRHNPPGTTPEWYMYARLENEYGMRRG